MANSEKATHASYPYPRNMCRTTVAQLQAVVVEGQIGDISIVSGFHIVKKQYVGVCHADNRKAAICECGSGMLPISRGTPLGVRSSVVAQ